MFLFHWIMHVAFCYRVYSLYGFYLRLWCDKQCVIWRVCHAVLTRACFSPMWCFARRLLSLAPRGRSVSVRLKARNWVKANQSAAPILHCEGGREGGRGGGERKRAPRLHPVALCCESVLGFSHEKEYALMHSNRSQVPPTFYNLKIRISLSYH